MNETKLDKISVAYAFIALARFLYGVDGTASHYMFHFDDFAIATYTTAVVSIVIAIAFLLPLSNRIAILFASINAASGLAGFLIMGWLSISAEEPDVVNPVLAPLVSAIVFSALLYFKPKLKN